MADPRRQQQSLDVYREALRARAAFQDLDDRATAAAVALVKARAGLAKRSPEEYFGLRPTERERFFAEELRMLLLDERPGVPAAADSAGDVEGSNPLLTAAARQAAKLLVPFLLEKLFGGDGGEEDGGGGPLDDAMEFIKKEKEYFKETDRTAGDGVEGTRERPN